MTDQQEKSTATPDIRSEATRVLGEAERVLTQVARGCQNAAKQAQGQQRGQLNLMAWRAAQMLRGERAQWFSQAGQDQFVADAVFKGKRGGVFMDLGAYDGVTGSNTLALEMFRGWTGLMVEPSPKYAAAARLARRAPVAEVAVGVEEGEAEFLHVTEGYTQMSGLADSYSPELRAKIEADERHRGEMLKVPVKTIAGLIAAYDLRNVDFISLDVEGAEVDVLGGFDFARYGVHAWAIENNSGGSEIAQVMQVAGYRLAEHIGVDEIYVRG